MAVQINTMDDESYLILHHSRSLSYYLQVIAHQEKLTKQRSYDLEQYSMETTNVNV